MNIWFVLFNLWLTFTNPVGRLVSGCAPKGSWPLKAGVTKPEAIIAGILLRSRFEPRVSCRYSRAPKYHVWSLMIGPPAVPPTSARLSRGGGWPGTLEESSESLRPYANPRPMKLFTPDLVMMFTTAPE